MATNDDLQLACARHAALQVESQRSRPRVPAFSDAHTAIMVRVQPSQADEVLRVPVYDGSVVCVETSRMVPQAATLSRLWPQQRPSVAQEQSSGPGPMRARTTKRFDRRLSHWQCVCCRRETPHAAGVDKCRHCGALKAELSDADASGREVARRSAREKESRGRSLNGRGAGTQVVPRHAQGAFERTRNDRLVRWETTQLEQCAGSILYLAKEDSMLGVMESFYIVHTGARVSIMDETKRAIISEADVASFFNMVGRRVDAGVAGEATFPFGGYFNEFRREGVTRELVRELR